LQYGLKRSYAFFNTTFEKCGSFRAVNNENRWIHVPVAGFELRGTGYKKGLFPISNTQLATRNSQHHLSPEKQHAA
jgi:hypothetical protein